LVSWWFGRTRPVRNRELEWFFNGLKDAEYNANMTRSMDLEASGGEAFFKYTYAFADEYKDIVPIDALSKKHVFGSYENIGHDVWHAAYGVYCPTLDSQKTIQYDWLLKQSLDGSPFVDPRNPNAGTGGTSGGGTSAGGSAGVGGAGGTAAGGTAPTTAGAGGVPTTPGAGTGGRGGGGTASTGAAGSNPITSGSADSNDSGGCSTAPTTSKRGGAGWLLVSAAVALSTIRRRRAQPRRGGALPAPLR
jgi:MYXO-CTERM domain-containing protein